MALSKLVPSVWSGDDGLEDEDVSCCREEGWGVDACESGIESWDVEDPSIDDAVSRYYLWAGVWSAAV